jgi:chromosomal replication initiator protein
MSSLTVWDQVLTRIEDQVGKHSFSTWFKPTSLLADGGQSLSIRVPNPLFVEWLPKHYSVVLAEALKDVGRAGARLIFIPDGSAADTTSRDRAESSAPASLHRVPPGEDAESADTTVDVPQRTGGLIPRYTFDTFIVGPSNQFAHAACRAVAETPSRSYNPLFIHGGVGLGKTHLMHAIGHYVLRHHPSLRLLYISSERFMNEMINALRFDKILEFRETYRSVDVLLVDDIQFVSKREGTQTEFVHTFNALHDAQKQIVISSDRPPQEIEALEERLRSRFTWGLTADIQPPDVETKAAILKRKAEDEGVPLPDNLAMFLATRVRTNIRELEGSLIRLIAYSSLTTKPLTIDLAQDVLRNVIESDEKAITIEQIQKYVAEFYHLKLAELKSRNNSKSVAMPRQVAMYLCKSLTHASLPEIGRSFGGKHHSTVIHSIKKVDELRKKNSDFDKQVATLSDSIK